VSSGSGIQEADSDGANDMEKGDRKSWAIPRFLDRKKTSSKKWHLQRKSRVGTTFLHPAEAPGADTTLQRRAKGSVHEAENGARS
jgi:hypothetical protein